MKTNKAVNLCRVIALAVVIVFVMAGCASKPVTQTEKKTDKPPASATSGNVTQTEKTAVVQQPTKPSTATQTDTTPQNRITGNPFVTFRQAPQLLEGKWVSVFPLGDTIFWNIRELSFYANKDEGVNYNYTFCTTGFRGGWSYGKMEFNEAYKFTDDESKGFPNSTVKSSIRSVGSYVEGDKFVFSMENGETTTFVREKINLASTKWKLADSTGNVYVIYSFMEDGTYRIDVSYSPAWLKAENLTGTYSVSNNFVTLKPKEKN